MPISFSSWSSTGEIVQMIATTMMMFLMMMMMMVAVVVVALIMIAVAFVLMSSYNYDYHCFWCCLQQSAVAV